MAAGNLLVQNGGCKLPFQCTDLILVVTVHTIGDEFHFFKNVVHFPEKNSTIRIHENQTMNMAFDLFHFYFN